MALINKIFIKNFKSFGKPTELIFGNRFNTVIGPNGSGKSNIFDAFCFVFGELSAKSMRAQKAANLIFNGGKLGSPSKEAEVSIFFDNKEKEFPTEEPELKITRVIRQTGQSIYKINNEKRTRQQILEILSKAQINPDGHNIVLQGDIVQLTEMKPDERRELVEGIAGISVYETKKHQAMNELNRVDLKINEANIILTERGSYLRELKKERDQAQKFKEYETKIKENKATHLYMQIKEKTQSKESIESQKAHIQKQLDKIDDKIKDAAKIITEKKQQITKTNNEIEEKGEKTQSNLQKGIEDLSTNVVRNATRADTLKSEINKIKERKAQLKKDLEEMNNKILSQNKHKENLATNLEKLKKQESSLAKQAESTKTETFQDTLKFDLAINKLINEKIQGVHGIVAQLGSIDQKYSTALAVTAGAKSKSLVVDDDKVASECIRYLKQNRLGVATFIPLNKIRPRTFYNKALLKQKGVLGLASDLIKFDKKHQKAFEYIFGSTVIVKDVETARNLGIGSARMVTLEGDLFEQSGIIVGGFRRIKSFFFRTLPKLSGTNLESKYDSIKTNIIQTQSEIKNITDQVNSIHLPEREKIIHIGKQHDKELTDFEAELNELNPIIKTQEGELENKRKQETKFYNEYKNLFAKRNKLSEEVNKLESKTSTEDFKIKEYERKINDFSIKRAKVTAELEALKYEFEEFKEVKIRRNISREDLKAEIIRCERGLRNMGNVNLKALEIYDEIQQEYQNLTQKMEKLKTEKEDVLTMMQEIETKKKSIFMKTFKEINENFKKTFIQLSTKGDAYLELENKEDPLAGGVEIKVRLAGTKFLDLKSLSGGEKTMTAISFIFAIQEFQPAAFYLLDEVDAALDKTNSALLAKLIQKYAGEAQYIMVSHNDNIITEADQIYGASMQKNGITKVVSLKV